jgi:hypothetical protein
MSEVRLHKHATFYVGYISRRERKREGERVKSCFGGADIEVYMHTNVEKWEDFTGQCTCTCAKFRGKVDASYSCRDISFGT